MAKYYVYTLARPDGSVFYIGKGTGNRIDQHEQAASLGRKGARFDVIRAVWSQGDIITKNIVFETVNSDEALDKERSLIEAYGMASLCNISTGGQRGSEKRNDFGTERDEARRQLDWLLSDGGYSQRDLSKLMNMTESVVSRMVKNPLPHTPSPSVCALIGYIYRERQAQVSDRSGPGSPVPA